MLCSYGCNQEAQFQLKNKKWCCSDSCNKCPESRRKNKLRNKDIWKNKSHPRGMLGKHTIAWNKGLTKETDIRVKITGEKIKECFQKNGGTFSGKKHTQESKDKIGKALLGNNHAKHQGNKGVFYKGIQMDSSWEVAVAKYLDEHNIIWKYEEKRFPVLVNETYCPDFFIYNSNGQFEKIIEVKGYFRKINKEKYDDFLIKYPNIKIELWQWKELRDRNLISSGGYIMEGYTVGVAGQTVDLISSDSGGSTPSPSTIL